MPIYEYICAACGHEFEQLFRAMSESRSARCPLCGSEQVERKLSLFAARQKQPDRTTAVHPGGPCRRCGANDGPCQL